MVNEAYKKYHLSHPRAVSLLAVHTKIRYNSSMKNRYLIMLFSSNQITCAGLLNSFLTATLILSMACSHGSSAKKKKLTDDNLIGILSFNLWVGGEQNNQPLEYSADVIRISGADIAGLQETNSYNPDGSIKGKNTRNLAQMLEWNFFEQGSSGIITRYSIVDSTENRLGIKLQIRDDMFLWFFNCHFNHMPYQPYQLAGKPYGDFPFICTEDEAKAFANQARGKEVSNYIREIQLVMEEGWPVVLSGDFNEPSFLDWTSEAVDKNLCPLKVDWPSTKAFHEIGMSDAFRTVYPDEITQRGETWSSIDAPGEIHDRIDFILYAGKQLHAIEAHTIGFDDGKSYLGIKNYPSDHRAVSIQFLLAEKTDNEK
jgi:exodeoxyribonuclease III